MRNTAANARMRARRDRIRAFVREPGHTYDVYSHGTKYRVWYNWLALHWDCNCPAMHHITCKHKQRVMDREEQRIKQEALQHAKAHV